MTTLFRFEISCLRSEAFSYLVFVVTATSAMPRDCSEIYKSGERLDGVYTVYVGRAQRRVQVYCDMTTAGGGWTVCIIIIILLTYYFKCLPVQNRIREN